VKLYVRFYVFFKIQKRDVFELLHTFSRTLQ